MAKKSNLAQLAKKLEKKLPKKKARKKTIKRKVIKQEVKEVKETFDITQDTWWKAIGDLTDSTPFVPDVDDESERLTLPRNLTEEVFEDASPLTQSTMNENLGDVKSAYENPDQKSGYDKTSYIDDSSYKAETSQFTDIMESTRDMDKTASERLLEGNTVNPALADFAHQETPKYSQNKKKRQ